MARGSLLGDRWFRTNPLERAFRHLVEIHCYLDSKLPHTTVTHLSFTPICDCRIAAYFACCCIFRIFRKVRISHIFSPEKIGIFDGNFSYFNIFVFLFESAGLLNLWGLCITFDRHKHWYRVVIRKFPPNCMPAYYPNTYIRWQWRNFNASCFRRHLVGKTLINVFHCDSAEIRFVGKIVIIQTFL